MLVCWCAGVLVLVCMGERLAGGTVVSVLGVVWKGSGGSCGSGGGFGVCGGGVLWCGGGVGLCW